MDFKFWLIIGAFYLIRAFFKNKGENKKKATGTVVPKKAKTKNLDDIFGDFMKEINKEKAPKQVPQTVLTNTDTHRAEDDTYKKLDWQEVSKSKFQEKKQQSNYSNYKKISNSDTVDEPILATSIENEIEVNNIGEIDLRKAVIYKEILDRKYFSI